MSSRSFISYLHPLRVMYWSFREVMIISSSSITTVFNYFWKMTCVRNSGTNEKSDIILRASSLIASVRLYFELPCW